MYTKLFAYFGNSRALERAKQIKPKLTWRMAIRSIFLTEARRREVFQTNPKNPLDPRIRFQVDKLLASPSLPRIHKMLKTLEQRPLLVEQIIQYTGSHKLTKLKEFIAKENLEAEETDFRKVPVGKIPFTKYFHRPFLRTYSITLQGFELTLHSCLGKSYSLEIVKGDNSDPENMVFQHFELSSPLEKLNPKLKEFCKEHGIKESALSKALKKINNLDQTSRQVSENIITVLLGTKEFVKKNISRKDWSEHLAITRLEQLWKSSPLLKETPFPTIKQNTSSNFNPQDCSISYRFQQARDIFHEVGHYIFNRLKFDIQTKELLFIFHFASIILARNQVLRDAAVIINDAYYGLVGIHNVIQGGHINDRPGELFASIFSIIVAGDKPEAQKLIRRLRLSRSKQNFLLFLLNYMEFLLKNSHQNNEANNLSLAFLRRYSSKIQDGHDGIVNTLKTKHSRQVFTVATLAISILSIFSASLNSASIIILLNVPALLFIVFTLLSYHSRFKRKLFRDKFKKDDLHRAEALFDIFHL